VAFGKFGKFGKLKITTQRHNGTVVY